MAKVGNPPTPANFHAIQDGLQSTLSALAQNAYITNQDSDNISVIDTATNTVIATIPAGEYPEGVAVSQDGRRAYITNRNRLGSGHTTGTVMVIDTATNTVEALERALAGRHERRLEQQAEYRRRMREARQRRLAKLRRAAG